MTPEEKSQVTKLLAAITPDHHSRAAYTGKIMQTAAVTIITEDGTPYETEVAFPVSWGSMQKMLELIQKRAIS